MAQKPAKTEPRTFRELTDHWYAKLKDEGFDDIEKNEKLLKEWHNLKFKTQKFKAETTQEYLTETRKFAIDPSFDEICGLLSNSKHGNNKTTPQLVRIIWRMHCKAKTHREISKKLGKSTYFVFQILRKLRTWMNLV